MSLAKKLAARSIEVNNYRKTRVALDKDNRISGNSCEAFSATRGPAFLHGEYPLDKASYQNWWPGRECSRDSASELVRAFPTTTRLVALATRTATRLSAAIT